MLLGIEMATNNQEECTRVRLVLAPVLPLLCSCYRACYPPFLFREMPILWASSAEKRSNFLFFTGTPRRKRSRCKRRLHFRKLESRKRPSTCSRSTPKRTRGFIRYGGCKTTITQPKSAFCQNEANG